MWRRSQDGGGSGGSTRMAFAWRRASVGVAVWSLFRHRLERVWLGLCFFAGRDGVECAARQVFTVPREPRGCFSGKGKVVARPFTVVPSVIAPRVAWRAGRSGGNRDIRSWRLFGVSSALPSPSGEVG